MEESFSHPNPIHHGVHTWYASYVLNLNSKGCTSEKVPHAQLNAATDWGRKVLHDLGRMLIFDVFINNWDRFPFIWRKDEGNHGNFLFLLENDITPIVGMETMRITDFNDL